VKNKQDHALSAGINPDTVREICEIASLLGVDPQTIVAEALDDWMRCIAPVRLDDALARLDAETAALRDRSVTSDASGMLQHSFWPLHRSSTQLGGASQAANGPCRLPAKS
jgi:hypothetical protein